MSVLLLIVLGIILLTLIPGVVILALAFWYICVPIGLLFLLAYLK